MAVVSLGIFIVAVNTTASEDAVVSFVIEGLASPEVTGWLHYTYLLALAPLLVIAGRLGDVFGKEHLYAYGFGLLAIGSVLFGLAPRFSWLVAFRAVQAVGAAAVLSLGIALLVEAFPRPERGSALGVAVSVGLVGSVLGSLLVDGLGWTWVSFGTVPIALVGILACRRFILANPPSDEQRFDLAGAILLAASMVCLILGLGLGLQNGYTDSWVMLLLTLSVLVFTNFVWIESRVDHPLLDLAMFKNLDFSVGLLTGFIVGVALTAASG
ncbi:MAG TPA: MFS transporter, partial [Actinobacteria bacterium]|nr:MFS transporter [Actinomycetota bacterium]